MEEIKLTQYSRGAGCGCKIAPAVLEEILTSEIDNVFDKNLLVGNETKDDAAVYDLGDGTAIISTTDFFMPIVDDAKTFGKVAAANAISDVYAMGGDPLMAIAILGWPVDKLPVALAKEVLEGAREICKQAGIMLCGGHSIDSAEPIFGLAVTGRAEIKNIKKNSSAKEGDLIFLTKPIGSGILSTALKRGVISNEHYLELTSYITKLNSTGSYLAKNSGINAMTDVTGFGLLGHVIEMADGSNTSVELYYDDIPVMEGVREYLKLRMVPDATFRNWNAVSKNVSFEKGINVMEAFSLLPDPQTNGGLLITCNPAEAEKIFTIKPIGKIVSRGEKTVIVKSSL